MDLPSAPHPARRAHSADQRRAIARPWRQTREARYCWGRPRGRNLALLSVYSCPQQIWVSAGKAASFFKLANISCSRALDQATAAEAEQRITRKQDIAVSKEKIDLAARVARCVDHPALSYCRTEQGRPR